MNAKPTMRWLALLVLTMTMRALAQNPPAAPSGPAQAPGLRKLSGEDERRAKQLSEAIPNNLPEAIAVAEEVLALWTRIQGATHFEAVTASWRVKTWRRLAALSSEDLVLCQTSNFG